MKQRTKFWKGLFWMLILVLLIAPLGLIFEISGWEKQQYATPVPPKFVETAYGRIEEALRIDMEETVLVTGTFRAQAYEYIELKQSDPGKIRWDISIGEEIQKGQKIGTYKGADMVATIDGLVIDINAYGGYIKVQMAEPVWLECDVSAKTLSYLRNAKTLLTEDKESVELIYAAKIRNPDGTIRVGLKIDSDVYYLDQKVENLPIYTGNIYMQTLVVPEECLYQRVAGEKEPWYVREVTESGEFVGEIEVAKGYSNGEWVSVTGISEGRFFDAGYKQIVEGDDAD